MTVPLPQDGARSAGPEPGWSNHPVATWLARPEHAPNETEDFFRALCERLTAEGIPLSRAQFGRLAMHPQVFARTYVWRRGGAIEVVDRPWGTENSDAYRSSPVYVIHQGADSLRRRLDVADPQLDFPILHELKAEGATDYVVMALPFSTGQKNFISWMTDRPGGFATADLSLLHDLLPLMSLRLELDGAYDVTNNLLNTYLGPAAARRVLAGTIKRAEGERLDAAIFYTDLRNFTAMADSVPPEEVIETLDDYFDCMIEPVKRRGGDVLKFIGDGMLAIFQIRRGDVDLAACRAISAAVEGFENLNRLNRGRADAGKAPLKVGVALHAGEVVFGNIGSADRLDFTVIGPAVNEVSRIDALSHLLDRPLVTSAEFAAHDCGFELESLGFHVLRGVRRPRELFGLPRKRLVVES